jgi:hypothetical protein
MHLHVLHLTALRKTGATNPASRDSIRANLLA